jgi:predicted AlkP superfamily pyrophosphatase or phosphodiesterase
LGENLDGWRWYASDVKVPRIWDVARDAGYRTALIDWPATVGAEATLHVPEFWRARIDEDLKLIGALSTPKDILQRVAREYPNFARGFRPQNVSDEAGFDLASYALLHVRPHLMFLHVWEVDHAQHVHGLWSKEATLAIENADRQLGRLLELIRELDLTEQTALVLASDHGFTNINRSFNPKALLKKAGLLSTDDQGKVTRWDAIAMPTHGSAYIYLRDDADVGVRTATLRVFQQAQRSYPNAIARILSREQIVAAGGDGAAFLALAAPLGTSFGSEVQQWESKPTLKATHGYDPEQPAMRASLLLFGASVSSGRLHDARLIDVAPTVAAWLGLQLPSAEGRLLQPAP